MKQILQNLRTGEMEVAEVPAPRPGPGEVLISTRASLISPGTERMLVEFSRANLVNKARQQPEKVKQVLDKIRTDGLLPTLETVFRKLDQPLPLGYCNAGAVLETGEGVNDLNPGDRVASNGPHAELVRVPRNLCAKIPVEVSDEEAAFTVMGAIALQGIRLARPELGETFLVFGMGLLGLLTVQLLRASGCEALAADLNPERLRRASEFGAVPVDLSAGADPVAAALARTGGKGVDGVLIAAAARDDDIIHQAATACRKRGRIILVGVVGLNLRRSDFYEKELTFQVSCSYGPGRYDEEYENKGRDYPYGFVRWTEGRNFSAVLSAIASGSLRVSGLISGRFEIASAPSAYESIGKDPRALGMILTYPGPADRSPAVRLKSDPLPAAGKVSAGVIGAGNFANGVLLPALARTPARLAAVADLNGAAARSAAGKFGAEKALTDYRLILEDPGVNAVFITVGHHLHARLAVESLKAGKHVFVEKPLALKEKELKDIISLYHSPFPIPHSLTVGFNRRFSPHSQKIRELIQGRAGPLCMTMTVNAGEIPAEHWIQDPERGGGRIVGEACHFIDLLSFLAGSPVRAVSALMAGEGPAVREDKAVIGLAFADGSVGAVNYFANGPKSYPKETLEVFSDGRVLKLDNFRVLRGYGFKGFRAFRTRRQDKGHRAELAAFVERVGGGGPPLIPLEELVNVTRAGFAALLSAREERTINLAGEYGVPEGNETGPRRTG